MQIMLALVFGLGYTVIALEHPLRLDKAATALLTAVLCWVLVVLAEGIVPGLSDSSVDHHLMEHLADIGSILFFLLGAMTIVELIDAHRGFDLVTSRIHTRSKAALLIILSFLTFFMSAALDNLTTTIVMVTLLRKLISDKLDLWLFAGMVVIAANAGGAWSPIGDVTTIMLWIGGQITASNIVLKLFLPSLVCMAAPLFLLAWKMQGEAVGAVEKTEREDHPVGERSQRIILFMGVGALLFVPVFKNLTHLPPFMGILLGLSVLWLTTEVLHRHMEPEIRRPYSIAGVLQRIDTPSILFFLGILLAVAALETAGILGTVALGLEASIGNIWGINTLIGLLSSIVDNVPLVAAAMGMYDMTTFPADHTFWELLAFCAGTGGSVLIIGSAAGVAAMGILRIDFLWYLRNVTLYALLGYFAGILTFYLSTNL